MKNFIITFKLVSLFMKLHALKHHNKMNAFSGATNQHFTLSALHAWPPAFYFDVASLYLWMCGLHTSLYKLPFRHNRGQLLDQYSPNYVVKKAKYPIANHIHSRHLYISCPWTGFLAIKEEMKALEDNKTWNPVPLPREKKIVFSIKHKSNGSIEIYKGKLVAKGYTQTYDIDY
ncbi:hypothetical protein CR513_49739, partial [Mucuna pruriens]